MNSDNSFQFREAIGFINSCCDFTHKDGRISTPFDSAMFVVSLILIYFSVGYALTYYKTINGHLRVAEAGFYAVPISIILGFLLSLCIKTNKVIDYKNNLIYCELLIFKKLICRYSCIKGDDIVAVGNNFEYFHTRRGVAFVYYTSFLLKDGTLNNYFNFRYHYSAAYNFAIVLAYYFHKPLTLAEKNEQLTISTGLRLSTLNIDIMNLRKEDFIRTIVWLAIVLGFLLFVVIVNNLK